MGSNTIITMEQVSKQYRIGTIGGATLKGDLQDLFARIRGKESPNLMIGKRSNPEGGRFWALRDINCEIRQGDRVGIIGRNGAGKSTLLKLLSRVTAPTEGEIYIKGRIASMLEVGTGFHPELTGRENVYMNGAILGMSKAEINRKLDQIIEFSEVEKFIDTPVKRYSSGMYVKLAFSVAAHLDNEILVMDEVLAVGDNKFQKKCLGKMSDVAENEGKTVLYVSHNMETIENLCDKCIVLQEGKIMHYGDTATAIQMYLQKYTGITPYVDISQQKKDSEQFLIPKSRMLSCRMQNASGILPGNEKFVIDLTWDTLGKTENLQLRILFISEGKYVASSIVTGL
ncbi:MAG TPA: ABC transporter ATP-binding protein, partial [Mobilitalea sp.]|nr:ABC transporter ATP-binding protein [Mobilitalea sp.]